MSHPLFAAYTRIAVCPDGCPVIVLSDENDIPIIQAHIQPGMLETLIADLRRAAAEGAALQRPPA